MTEPAEAAETEAPAIPTDAELAFSPEDKDPYFVPRDKSGKFLPRAEAAEAEQKQAEEPEAKTEAKSAEPEKEEEHAPTAKEIANAKRYRKDLARRERELNRERDALAADRAEMERLRTMRRDNPRAVLDELGLSFRELAEEAAKQDGEDPRDKSIRELRAELEELKGFKQTLSKERESAAQQQSYQADVEAVAERIQNDADAYPFLADYGNDRAARAAVNAWYAKHEAGEKPDLIEILDSLEGELSADYERLTQARAKRNGAAVSSPAVQAKGAPGRVNGAGKASEARGGQAGTPPPATLTNRTAAERASPDRALSRDERRKLAASRLVVRE